MVGIEEVCIAGGAGNQISRGAQPIIKASRMGWLVWYAFCIFYMFIALAVVCDEFFVPALECFVDEFGISMDVAGATFMAAGGSMPELFTSVIATFKESEVGFVAIVGSAVFNVLFVIAVCAIFAKEVLELTWWPLFRDCIFYVIALLTVAFVFAVSSKNEIEWWEAVLLLLEYVVYCVFMKFNSKVKLWIEKQLHGTKEEVENMDDTQCVNVDQERFNVNFLRPSTFRTGILQLLTKNAYLHEIAGISAVTKIEGDLKETFKKLDKDNDGRIRPDELKELFELLGVEKDNVQIKTVIRRISRNGDEFITFENFKRWYISSEIRIEAEVGRVFEKMDKNQDGKLELEEVKQSLEALGHKPTKQEVQTLMCDIKDAHHADIDDKANMDMITFADFEAWYQSSMFYQAQQERNEQEEEEEGEERFDLSMPEDPTWCNMIWYVLTYPLCAILFCTLPDVRTERYRRNWKWAVAAFLLSLVWIGIFSNWLYECLVVVSNTLRIPIAVSAVTLLAGGTSCPDLISSYVVARNGQGDMAVSSSIGSNIFDVTVGLPLPWLIYTIAYGKPFSLGPQGSKGLGFSIILLVLMLAAVVGTIVCMKWRMTKGLGVAMLAFYIVYVVQYLLQKLPARCNADETGVFQAVF
jgi:K+-dependent Na+/Ca+ exchanger-like protein